ncbi:molybdopterin-dependent oxidoreductase [Heliobacterium chlorum]|uniref:Molybdopterin-dependent oxidoreductase n=1 Tax=Heliobacterium chlorum TaxID=2698 RepID=A0ABR7T842_HELCL|nr:molybdopterin-dependent oxidoreductase [Heliobacterium chlorum]MBC9786203.1 molybdopterin-dependent oxidoreductase [Heliobacterium chlorum]
MKRTVLSACPLHCYDLCSFQVHLEGERIVDITGNPRHPVTRGFVCSQATRLIERQYSPDRITAPLLRVGESWRRASWDEALDHIAQALAKAFTEYGPGSILHMAGTGSTGVLKQLDRRFFYGLGGVTVVDGTMGWEAGLAAQRADFGEAASPAWADLVRAKTIFLWGRDPATTNTHLIPYLAEAKEKGAKVILIDPLRTASAQIADEVYRIQPGTDGLLALSMAYVILENRWWDSNFVTRHVNNFASFAKAVAACSPEIVGEHIGLEPRLIRTLARLYAKGRPSALVLGAGLLRYGQSGLTVRAIDALAAITGQLGISGGGIHLANDKYNSLSQAVAGEKPKGLHKVAWTDLACEIDGRRENSHSSLKQSGLKNSENGTNDTTGKPPIQIAVINRANPASQVPDIASLTSALHTIPFKVVIDFTFTDTARLADVILPAATSFEAPDLIASERNDYIHYQPAVVAPRGQVLPEICIWQGLAQRLIAANASMVPGLVKERDHWNQSAEQWLEEILQDRGLSLEGVQGGPRPNPGMEVIPFKDGSFATPSGKVELAGETEFAHLLCGNKVVPIEQALPESASSFRMLFVRPKGKRNSQFWDSEDMDESNLSDTPSVRLHPEDMQDLNVRPGDEVIVESEQGSLIVTAHADDDVPPRTAVITPGQSRHSGGGVNLITPPTSTDLGPGFACNETKCTLRKLPKAERILYSRTKSL